MTNTNIPVEIEAHMFFYSMYDVVVIDTGGNIGIGTVYPQSAIDTGNNNVGFVIPTAPVAATSTSVSTPTESVKVGTLRVNASFQRFEVVNRFGNSWKSPSSGLLPYVTTATPTKLQNIGMQAYITGANFEPYAQWSFIGNDATEYPCVSQNLGHQDARVQRPDYFPVSNEPYRLRIYNPDTKLEFVTSTILFDAGEGPAFVQPSGSLSNLNPSTTYTRGIVIDATDEVGGGISNITINNPLTGSGLVSQFVNGSLFINGTTSNVSSVVTYNFIASALDTGGNVSSRAYSFSISPLFNVTGGTIVNYTGYRAHVFTSSGSLVVTGTVIADFLLVAGGGGGGSTSDRTAGGGGAGGYLYFTNISINAGTYAITIGGGGGSGTNGGNSIFLTYTAIGGGRGGGHPSTAGGSGGSGGGRYHNPAGSAGSGTSGQGNAGGPNGYDSGSGSGAFTGSGGGGAGAVGSSGTSSGAGAGGIGVSNSVTGTATYYAGGGGGAAQSLGGQNLPAGAGGTGGGGSGAQVSTNSVTGGNATANRGGGGGGGGGSGSGGSGGSGIFVIRYPIL